MGNGKFNRPEESTRSAVGRLVVLLVVLSIPAAVIWWPGCRHYPPVKSPESLALIKLMYSACNTQDPNRLTKAEERFTELDRQQKLSTTERQAFEQILSLAKSQQWKKAEAAAYQFAEDQVGR